MLRLPFAMLSLLTVTSGLLTPTTRHAAAELTGDKEALVEAADLYRANLNRVKSWSGAVDYERKSRSSKDKDFIQVKCSIEFVHDVEKDKLRYALDVLSHDVVQADGTVKPWVLSRQKLDELLDQNEENLPPGIAEKLAQRADDATPRILPVRRARLVIDGVYYDAVYLPEKKDAGRAASIRSKPQMRAGFGYAAFDPMYFFNNHRTPFDEYWRMYAKDGDKPRLDGTVAREGSLVVLTIHRNRGTHTGTTETKIDLEQGGNVIQHRSTQLQDGNLTNVTYDWTWFKAGDVFVPQSVKKRFQRLGDTPSQWSVSLKWKRSEVNMPIADSEFTFAKLGLREKDRLHDTRDGTMKRIGDPSSLLKPSGSR